MSEASGAFLRAGEALQSLHRLLHASCIGALPEYEDVQLSRVRCGLSRVCSEIAPVQDALVDLAGCLENWCSNPSKLYWKQSSSALMALQAKHAAALEAWLETRFPEAGLNDGSTMQDSAAHQLSQEGWLQLSCLQQAVTSNMIACSAVLSAPLLLSDDLNNSAHNTASLSDSGTNMGEVLTGALLLTSTSRELHQDKCLLGSGVIGVIGDSCGTGSHSSSGTACVVSLIPANASAGCKIVSSSCTDAPSYSILDEAELLQLQQACSGFVRSCRPLLGQLQGYQEVAVQLAARQAARAAAPAAAAAGAAAESSPSCRCQQSRWAGLLTLLRRGRLRWVVVSGSVVVLGGVLTYCWWLRLQQQSRGVHSLTAYPWC